MGAEQALKGPIVGSKAPERTGGWLAVRSRGGVRGYAIGLLALVLAAAVALALAPFVDAKSASLLLLGAVMVAAWFGGLGPGLATALLAAVASASLFTPTGVLVDRPFMRGTPSASASSSSQAA